MQSIKGMAMKSRKGAEKRGHWSVMVAEEMLACGLTGWWSELREWVEWLEGVGGVSVVYFL